MKRVREISVDEIIEATRVLQIAGADAEQSLFISGNRESSDQFSQYRESFHGFIQTILDAKSGKILKLGKD